MPWPNVTPEEEVWIKEHGCIHGMYPEEDVIFCPTCKPDASDLLEMVGKRCTEIQRRKEMEHNAKIIEGISRDLDTLTAREMCMLFPMIKDRLGRLGLMKTMHKFDDAQNALGWEVAEHQGDNSG